MTQEELLKKWEFLIEACKNYYIESKPTGLLDSEYDELEKRAILEDGFSVRDYVFKNFMQGKRAKNSYITKITKTKVEGSTMIDAIVKYTNDSGKKLYWDLKYDGSSIAIYLDPQKGTVKRVVSCGNLNLSSEGIDQTSKIYKLLPKRFPKGIVAIQCEALVDTTRIDTPERARQKANSLITSVYMEKEVSLLLTLRVYRYYTDDSPEGMAIRCMDYRNVLQSFETVRSLSDGHITFAPADSWTVEELLRMPGFTETDCTVTSTGKFNCDGWTAYTEDGICLGALKYAGAGSGTELITTTVKSIQWNNQVSKGKDSWSANVIVDPVVVKGCTIRKPSAGSVGKLVKEKITPGAEVSIILANSTIPVVGKVVKAGNGDYQWPTCSCGHIMSEKDVFGSLLKCSNPDCTERKERMKSYISSLKTPGELDLNKFLVIDRFKWETTDIDINRLITFAKNSDPDSYRDYLMEYMKTELQKKNMEVVWKSSYFVLNEKLTGNTH